MSEQIPDIENNIIIRCEVRDILLPNRLLQTALTDFKDVKSEKKDGAL